MVTERFYPPWSDGIVAYARSMVKTLVEASKSRPDLDINILSSFSQQGVASLSSSSPNLLKSDEENLRRYYYPEKNFRMNAWTLARKLSKSENFDVTHLLAPKSNPLLFKLSGRNRIALKHIFIYPFHSSFNIEKMFYSILGKKLISNMFNVNIAFSAEIFKTLYNLEHAEILPPAIDTKLYCPKILTEQNEQLNLTSAFKFGSMTQVLEKDHVLLYVGPFLQERFDFKTVIRSLIRLRKEYNLDVGLSLIGRELGDKSRYYFEDLRRYVNRNNLDDYVFACLKNLSETEKICLFNSSDVFLYPFHTRLCGYSVVFPPIVLLESMSAGLSVVSGGLPYLDNLIQDNENGTIIDDTISEKLFTEAIVKAITNKKKISKNGRLTIEKSFSIKHVSKLYLNFLSRIGI